MSFGSLSFRITNSSTENPFSDSFFLHQYGISIPVMTSVSQFVSVLQRFNIKGPDNFNEVHLDNPIYFKHIGRGAQFTVFKPIWGAASNVVMKRAILNDAEITERSPFQIKEDFRRRLKTLEVEVKALCHDRIRQHPNIVSLKAWGYDYPTRDPQFPSPVLIVEQAACTLSTLLKSPDILCQNGLSTMSRYQLCLDIMSGLECLHQCNIVHGDLKPDNILIFMRNHDKVPYLAKLADFGLCITIEPKEDLTYSRYRSTPGWQPPEITDFSLKGCRVGPELLYKCDSYSYGLVALSTLIFDGKSPLGGSNRRGTDAILIEASTAISQCKSTSLYERELLERHSGRIFAKLLPEEPRCRSLASIKLLEDTSCRGYGDWVTATSTMEYKDLKRMGSPAGQDKYVFWTKMGRAVLRQLIEDHKTTAPNTPSLQLAGDVLFGMAIGFIHSATLQPDFRNLAMDCCVAATRVHTPSSAACEVLPRLAAALRPEWNLEAEIDVEDILFKAGCAGSWFAVRQLEEEGNRRSTSCRELHRGSGGYNEERLDSLARVAGMEAFPGISAENGFVNIPMVALRGLKAVDFARSFPLELSNQPIDDGGNTILHLVSMLGRHDLIGCIVEKGNVSIDQVNNAGETPLYKACADGSALTVRKLLKLGADASINENRFGISCLHWLFQMEENEAEDIAVLLIQSGGCVNCRTDWNSRRDRSLTISTDHFPFYWPHGTPLHWAVHVGSLKMAQILLHLGADVDAGDVLPLNNAHTPLSSAIYQGDFEMVSFLLEHGADPNKEIITGTTALHWLTKSSAFGDLLRSNFLRHWVYRGGWERSLGISRNCISVCRKYGATFDGKRLLIDAADSGDGATLIALLELGVTPGLVDDAISWKKSALHTWCGQNPLMTTYPDHYFEVLTALIQRTDWASLDEQAQHSLFRSAIVNGGKTTVVKRIVANLLQAGGPYLSINALDEYHCPPIAHALQNVRDGGQESVALTTLFLELGAQRVFRDSYNRDFLWWLTNNYCITDAQCLFLLRQYMSGYSTQSQKDMLDQSRCSVTGVTALMNLAKNSLVECLKFALDLQVDLNAEDEKGRTALDHALESGNAVRCRLLRNWAMHRIGEPSAEDKFSENFLFDVETEWEDHFVRGLVSNSRERYFAYPNIIRILADAGAKTGHGYWVRSPRSADRNFVELYKADWFVRDKQPFYDLWKPLYEHDKWIWILVDFCDRVFKKIRSCFWTQSDPDSTLLSRYMKNATIERLPTS
ncbi:hypothetical protein F5Y00DRAFT_270428 [Daldinia vernicosa]|uniref:uncharacterized protein n=1 Tax=Daldinia vernicosa TaxID=114800 RepID=UPI00200870D6|nr:uncharacterized protein F5Y00DRAFT_270428 [Daldinia vernicosa]KAI0847979.1 hypothetical protein F5Y00DRAFT_270428 [Daldinia vernicosa]